MVTRTDKGILLIEELLAHLRQNNIMIPVIDIVERTCVEAMTGGDKIGSDPECPVSSGSKGCSGAFIWVIR